MQSLIKRKYLFFVYFLIFLIFTLVVKFVDVQEIGPECSVVGLATINNFFRMFLGLHLFWYHLTDWMGLIPVFLSIFFGFCGLLQFIKRRSLIKVDKIFIKLGFFYILLILVYLLFEKMIINFRPVILGSSLEASYPSSHTMISLCIFETGLIVINQYIKNQKLYKIIKGIFRFFEITIVLGRIFSGVHWFTDIIGGVLLSICLIEGFYNVMNISFEKNPKSKN